MSSSLSAGLEDNHGGDTENIEEWMEAQPFKSRFFLVVSIGGDLERNHGRNKDHSAYKQEEEINSNGDKWTVTVIMLIIETDRIPGEVMKESTSAEP